MTAALSHGDDLVRAIAETLDKPHDEITRRSKQLEVFNYLNAGESRAFVLTLIAAMLPDNCNVNNMSAIACWLPLSNVIVHQCETSERVECENTGYAAIFGWHLSSIVDKVICVEPSDFDALLLVSHTQSCFAVVSYLTQSSCDKNMKTDVIYGTTKFDVESEYAVKYTAITRPQIEQLALRYREIVYPNTAHKH